MGESPAYQRTNSPFPSWLSSFSLVPPGLINPPLRGGTFRRPKSCRLRRVHECVFGILALESEPVDPRL
jgi:hypothetical protein